MTRFDRNNDTRSSESRSDYEKRRTAGAVRREEERREQLRRQQEMRAREEAYQRRLAYERQQQAAWRPENPGSEKNRFSRSGSSNSGQGSDPNQARMLGRGGYTGNPNQGRMPSQGGYAGNPNQGRMPSQGGYAGNPNQGRVPVGAVYPGNPNQGRMPDQGGYPGTEDNRNRKKKKGGRLGSVISTIILLIALAVFAIAAWKLIGFYLDYKAGSDEYTSLNNQYVEINSPPEQDIEVQDQETEPISGQVLRHLEELEDPEKRQALVDQAAKETTVENQEKKELPALVNPINFDELTQVNDEVIGWIRLGALNLSYPIAQADDNDYYLHRTFERQDNFKGCIFLNCDNSKFFTDMNSVVYGHNMKDGSMFGSLHKIGEQALYDENPYFWIFTPTLIYQYRIFSTGNVSVQGDPYKIRFLSEDFAAFIQNRQENSTINNHGVQVGTDDRIVTLSTCTSDDTTRFIAQGVLEQVYIAK